ncbi:MAG: hypothetical protein IKC49_03300, partial [Clostridia bacterium]|nr:hypothetical protein [Clostridia bacterium]
MSFAFYSSGEKDYDEDGELVYVLPKSWTTRSQAQNLGSVTEETLHEVPSKSANIIIPKELDEQYYISHRDNYIRGSREWWDWQRLKNYANATLDFIRVSFQEFVRIFHIDISNQKVPAFLLHNSKIDLDSVATALSEAEWLLAKQYTQNRRTFVTNKMNRHKAIARLQKTAKLCWGYYYACKGYYPIGSAVKASKMNEDLANLTDEQIVQLYGLCQKTKYHILKLDKSVYSDEMAYYRDEKSAFTAKRPQEIYPNVKMLDLFDIAMESFSLPKSDIFSKVLHDMLPVSYNLGAAKPLRKREFKFYDNYTTMRRLLWRVKCITNRCEEGSNNRLFPYDDVLNEVFPDEERVDLYERAVEYLKSCVRLANDLQGFDEVTLQDVEILRNRFDVEVSRAKDYYERTHKIDESELEDFY